MGHDSDIYIRSIKLLGRLEERAQDSLALVGEEPTLLVFDQSSVWEDDSGEDFHVSGFRLDMVCDGYGACGRRERGSGSRKGSRTTAKTQRSSNRVEAALDAFGNTGDGSVLDGRKLVEDSCEHRGGEDKGDVVVGTRREDVEDPSLDFFRIGELSGATGGYVFLELDPEGFRDDPVCKALQKEDQDLAGNL